MTIVEKENNQSPANKTFFKNVTIVLISNIVSLVSGLLIGFIIPKILGVSEYGHYKTFTLYCSYIGVLHFGFIDGIYLKFAGKRIEDLDEKRFRTYTRFLFLLEGFFSLVAIIVSFFCFGTDWFLLLLFIGLNIFATNVICYFEFISQITMRFKLTTTRNIIRCSLNIISVFFLYVLYKFNNVTIFNYIYVSVVLSINYLLMFWYIFTYRTFVFGKANSIREEKNDILYFFKVGFVLLLSNLVSQFIFVVDQQFVNIAFDNETYSLYAFAYNLISLITIATGAVSAVLYPTLKKIDSNSITNNYEKINAYLLIFVAFCLCIYYPLVLIVSHFLSQYSDSLQTFLIILPGVLISSSISVIKYNCYKAFGNIANFFIKSLIALALAIAADFAVFFFFKNTFSISMVSIFVLLVWYVLVELFFVKRFGVKWIRNLFYILLVIIGFYSASFIPNLYLGLLGYLVFYFSITVLMYRSFLQDLLHRIKERRNKQ